MSTAPGAMPVEPSADAAPEIAWERLSARMLLVHPLRAVRELLPALLPILVVGNSGDGDRASLLLNLGALGLVLVVSVVRWMTTRYRVTPQQVQLRHGLINRQTITVPLDRVRTVDVEARLMHRLLRLTKVVIGTGAHSDHKPLALDGLEADQGEALRLQLLHRAASAPTPAGDAEPGALAPIDPETTLVRFDPAWIAYAPLSTIGLISALAVWGLLTQLLGALSLEESFYDGLWSTVAGRGLVLGLVLVAAGLVALVALGAVVSYALTFWGHTVTRHGAGTLRITRGLLTTRSTTLEEARIRGVRLHEQVLLRRVGAASLSAVVTGLGKAAGVGGAVLLPASPVGVDRALADAVLGTPVPLATPLSRHGRAATRRRWSRTLQVSALALAVPALTVWWWGWTPWLCLPGALLLLVTPLLATSRARALGHAVTPDHLVVREGALEKVTTALELDGVLGWELRQTIFQRRVGVATLTALTAAGHGGYRVLDVPLARAYEIVATTGLRVVGHEEVGSR